MYKCIIIIAALCIYVWAEKNSDSLSVIDDSGAIYIPDPGRIAQDRIKKIRAFIEQNSLSQNDSIQERKPEFPITLDDATEKLITNNKVVQKAKLEYLIGEKRFHATFGTFEPYFTGNHEFSRAQRRDALLIESRETLRGGIEGVLPTGTRYGYSLTQKNIRYPQNTLDWPGITSTVSITQPLLKDFLGNGPLSDVKIAKTDRQIAYNRYRATLMAQCYDLESTYWKLVYLQEKRRNAEISVAIANQIVDDSRTLVASGKMSKLDAVEVTSQLAKRKIALSSVKIEHVSAMNNLMQMLGYSADSALISPTAVTPLLVNPDEQIPDSLSIKVIDSLVAANQPDLLSAKYTRVRSQLTVFQQKGKTLPELNLTGAMGVSGENKVFNKAVDLFFDPERNKHNWAVGVEVKIPLCFGIREWNILKAEKLNAEVSEIDEKSLRNELTTQAVLTAEKIRDFAHNLTNAALVVGYRNSLLQSELVQLRAGLSNARKIFEMEQELANAREGELDIRAQFRMSLSFYDRLLGMTLNKRGLEEIRNGKPVLVKELYR